MQKVLLSEAANLICWFRILASVLLMFIAEGKAGWAVLYSLAFISDVWDGWFYRRVPKAERPQHWFNRLPISMDPIADYVLVIGGIMYWSDRKWIGMIASIVITVILLVWQLIGQNGSDRLFMISMNILTYFWFGMMVLALGMVWFRSVATPWWVAGFELTIVVFYTCFFTIRDKTRTIRKRG